MNANALRKYSISEYLEMESVSLEKHEYYQGEVFSMADASINHNKITRNALISVGNHLIKNNNCQIFPSDLKIYIPSNSLITYPDLSIICGEIETMEGEEDIVTNPKVIIEVLSKSTQDNDRGGKFKLYRDILSLQEYILISSYEIYVEKHIRNPDGSWLLTTYENREASILIDSIDYNIPLTELYRNTNL